MSISSAKFVKSLVGEDELLEDGTPQIAFIGRSNVGKSSVINSLVGQKDLAKTSSFPGLTKLINIFLVSKSVYFVDLPGYGFAKVNKDLKQGFQQLTEWYLFENDFPKSKVVLIIDAKVGPMESDVLMFQKLQERKKHVIIVANKIDKVKKSDFETNLKKIHEAFGRQVVIPYSSVKRTGIGALTNEIFK
jgi:GTP-binding protein